MLSVEDWAEIRRLYRAEGLPIKMIARIRGVSRNTVRAAIASDGPPRYVRRPKGSIVDAASRGSGSGPRGRTGRLSLHRDVPGAGRGVGNRSTTHRDRGRSGRLKIQLADRQQLTLSDRLLL